MSFDDGNVVSDAGLLPIRELDQPLGILAEAASRLPDPRSPLFVTHTAESILTQQGVFTVEDAIRSVACAIVCAGSIIGAGLGVGGENGYFVVLLGFIGFVVFGLFTIRMVTGTANFAKVMDYLLIHQAPARCSPGRKS